MTDIIVDDEYVSEIADYIKGYGENFETFFDRYLEVMGKFNSTGVSSGATAAAVRDYIATAAALKAYVGNLSELFVQVLTGYLDAIDEADRYLY